MRTLRILFLSLAILCGRAQDYSNVGHVKEPIWVAIRVRQNVENEEYQGQLSKDAYNEILAKGKRRGWLKLEKCYWEKDNNIGPQSKMARPWGIVTK